MSGKITRIFILTLAVFFCFSFFSCSDVNYKEGGKKDDGASERKDRNFTLPEKPNFSGEKCSEYKSSVQSFRPLSDLLSTWLYGGVENNPFRKSEACMIKSIDQSLGPLCEEERILKAELKEYRGDREIEEEIQEELQAIEEAKYEYADILYEFADEIDEVTEKALEFQDTDNRWKIISNLLVTREARGFAHVMEIRARRLCGSSLRRQTKQQ